MELEDITTELNMIESETGFKANKYFWKEYYNLESCTPVNSPNYTQCMNDKYKTCMQLTYLELGNYTLNKKLTKESMEVEQNDTRKS